MKFAREVEEAQQAMHAAHSARGILQSSMTVIAAIRLTEEHANRYLDQAIALVGDVKKDQESFDLIVKHLTATFRTLEAHVRKATRFAFGGEERAPNVIKAADERFAEARDQVMGRLQIERFNFLRASADDAKSAMPAETTPLPQNSGGKPLAEHWDGMWAAIAVQLWLGDLKPKKQGDIKKAMFAWLNDAGIEAGDSAVTARARALWQAMQRAE